MVGDLPGYGVVWYDPKSIANILSLKWVAEKYHVAFDSGDGGSFIVTKPDGTVFEFRASEGGLYFLDTEQSATVMVNTVADNKVNYTNEDYLKAVHARELQIKIGRPSTKDFVRIVTSNQLPNCPVTKADILAAEHIFGPDVGSLKGKTVRRRPHLAKPTVEPLPPQIMSRYRNVTLAADVMHVNGVPMLVTISRHIRFATVEALPNRNIPTLLKGIQSVTTVYKRAGFRVLTTMMDGEFEAMRGDLADLGIALNEAARDEHVGEIERFIRTLKERMRAIYNSLPFTNMPPRIVIEMAKHAVYWLNAFPHPNGVSNTLSPRTIVTGQTVDFTRHCRYEFGQYVQTHEQHDNSMAPRTIGALAMRPTGNAQGNYYFFSLSTGRIINRAHATKLPMPDDVIARVHLLARRQKANPGLVFLDRNRLPANEPNELSDSDNDDDDDSTYASDADDDFDFDSDDDDDDDDSEYHPHDDAADTDDGLEYDSDDTDGTTGVDADNAPAAAVPPAADETTGVDAETDVEPEDETDAGETTGVDADEPEDEPNDGETTGVDTEAQIGETTGVDADADADAHDTDFNDQGQLERDMEARYGPRTERYNMRQRKQRDYSHLFATEGTEEAPVATPQMSMKRGLKEFGDDGVAAVKSEMLQLHDRKVMAPKHATDLTPSQKREALAYLMFLKRKRCGKVKGRGCADGRKQRAYTAREDAASPTVATESVFLTAVIDALEGRDVAVIDVPGAFMQADMDELVHV
jgi:hypothetical protein